MQAKVDKAMGGLAGAAVASYELGTGLLPYLSDHGFQGMTVVPGSMYVELALRIHQDLFHAPVGLIGPVEFLNPVVLGQQTITLSVITDWVDSHKVRYAFYDISPDAMKAPAQPCATVDVECETSVEEFSHATWPSIKAFWKRPEYPGGAEAFYNHLRKNGNEYGPCFQTLKRVWQSPDEAVGQLHVCRDTSGTVGCILNPIMLDGLTQLLSSFYLDCGQTFILQGIEELKLFRSEFPEEIWVYGRLRADGNGTAQVHVGDLDAFDESGAHLIRLRGVRFTYLDRSEAVPKIPSPKTQVVIASSFTAEPIEDSLQFWGDYLGFPTQVSFAPYNQIFQQLLSPHSLFQANLDGFNVILLNLADWVTGDPHSSLKIEPSTVTACFHGLDRHTLPNGLEVAHLNLHETQYLYREIFEDRCYLRHGVRLTQNANIIDIGANIGLFSLFVRSCCPHASVYAFEPSPVAFRALKANCEVYGPGLYSFNQGVSERPGAAALTFYEKSSVFSTFHATADEDRQVIRSVVTNMVRHELGGTSESVNEYVQQLVKDRLDCKTFECPLISVSEIIRNNGLQRVDLLKIDAEKCELEILRGIDQELWPCIDQVVVEVHDRTALAVDEVQRILSKHGFHCAVEEEQLLAGSGLYNVYATRTAGEQPVEPIVTELQAKVDQFVQALVSFTQRAAATTILCFCPVGKTNSPQAVSSEVLAAFERQLITRARRLARVVTLSSETILARYPTVQFHDPLSAQQGHVPYSPEGFAALGSSLFRTFSGLRQMPYKVIVLDCDNTLWQGACGELGPLEVTVTPAHRLLQEFMVRQMKAGMLLCLCSKNTEADVWAVFERNPAMVLRREHFASSQINWKPKSENLRALAADVKLGPQSFVFLDDDPVECAEARANCPEALTLLFPRDVAHLGRFLDHIWAFDHLRLTEEDLTRTQKVVENAQREKYRGQVASLGDFIDGLGLEVNLFEPGRDLFSRVSQLTFRTNQFNFTTIRRSETELVRFLERPKTHALVVTVSDRFGDYGTVGLLLYLAGADCYEVDTFLLSCRALGRGVEHRILAQFGRHALSQGKQSVLFQFRHTDKNQAAWEFISSIGAEFMCETEGGASIRFPAETLANLRYDPERLLPSSTNHPRENGTASGRRTVGSATVSSAPGSSEQFQRIADELSDVKDICSAIVAFRLRAVGGNTTSVDEELPATLSGRMLGIWRRVIGNPRIGVNDNFADVGGTSLKAVQIVAAVRRELNVHLSIVNIFECPNVRLLCAKLDPVQAHSPVDDAIQRGAKRKQRLKGARNLNQNHVQ